MLLAKNWPFFQVFILGNIGQENVFYNVIERKNGFLRYKKKEVQKVEKLSFSKGVSPCCWPKIGLFPNF